MSRDSSDFVLGFCGEVSDKGGGDCIVARGTRNLDGVFANGDDDADGESYGFICLDDVSKFASLWPVNEPVLPRARA